MTKSQPGETKLYPNSEEIPPGLFQNNSSEYPRVTVGMINGISASVSMALSHFDLPLTINQARGKPPTRSTIETKIAIANDMYIADKALLINEEFPKICPITFHLKKIPRIGGTRINTKKKVIAAE